jgi:hypothetical protein
MTAIAITAAPTFRPARPLLDSRPRRGKHRAARTLAVWRTARAEFAVAAATLGGALAATVLR